MILTICLIYFLIGLAVTGLAVLRQRDGWMAFPIGRVLCVLLWPLAVADMLRGRL